MNLSPAWIEELAKDDHDSVHWRDVGAQDAPDDDILLWAASNDRTVFTADLDFAASVATRNLSAPAIVQLRTDSTDPYDVGEVARRAIARVSERLSGGAILTINASKTRFRADPHTPADMDEN